MISWIIKGVLIVVIFLVIPTIVGKGISCLTKRREGLAFYYVIGNIAMWSMFELIAVPVIYYKSSFSTLFNIYSITLAIVFLFFLAVIILQKKKKCIGSENTHKSKNLLKKRNFLIFIFMAGMIGMIGFQMSQYILYTHRDDDDGRFVVNACDAYENNTMYTTHYSSGENKGEVIVDRDLTSPWSMYVAWQARAILIYPTIVFHTICPAFLLLMGYCTFWLLGGKYFRHDWLYTSAFVFLTVIVNTYFDLSVYTSSTFFLIRIWQGKSVVAGVMIPLFMYLYYRIYSDYNNVPNYILLFIANIAICLLSGAGVLLAPIVNFAYGTSYSVAKKSIKIFIGMMVACIPALFYGVLYILIR